MSWDIFSKSKIQYFLEKLKGKFVQKETGKGLSSNDYTTTDKNKVALIDNTTTSATGNPISIADLKSAQIALNPVITYNPIQDLHGQSKPYPAGGGKNLIPLTLSAIQTVSANSTPTGSWSGNTWNSGVGITIEVLCDSANNVSGLKVNGTATSNVIFHFANNMSMRNQKYTLSGCPSGGSAETYRIDARNMATSIMIDYGNGVTFDSAESNDGYIVVRVGSGTQVSNAIFKPQLESGSTKTAFAPYSNICPISGYDKIEVLSCQKNLFDSDQILQASGWSKTNGVYSGNITDLIVKFGSGFNTPKFKANTQYTISYYGWVADISTNRNFRFVFNYTDGTSSQVAYNNYTTKTYITGTSTSGKTVASIGCTYGSSTAMYLQDIQLEESASATTYVPYHKTTDLSESLGQMVYWGEYDVRTGKFKVIGIGVDMGSLTWTFRGTNTPFYSTTLTNYYWNDSTQAPPLICSCYETVDQGHRRNNTIAGYNMATNTIMVNDNSYDGDANAFTTAVTGQMLVYGIQTPFTIQLTPHEIALSQDYAYISTNGALIALAYHNGEMAALSDVAQLSETVERLTEYIKGLINNA